MSNECGSSPAGPASLPDREMQCEVLIAGGGMGGVAAALAAARAGRSVLLVEETDWLGGQMTSQGVSALDEHRFIETFGGTRSYQALRQTIREIYRSEYPFTESTAEPLNPGNGWVSRLCFEPAVGARAVETLLAPHVEAGRLQILHAHPGHRGGNDRQPGRLVHAPESGHRRDRTRITGPGAGRD